MQTVFGWHVQVGDDPNPRSLRNFPMQANGAEMLRIACCLATERGIKVVAPVHDAVLICAPLDRLDHDIAAMRAAMAEASRVVLRWVRDTDRRRASRQVSGPLRGWPRPRDVGSGNGIARAVSGQRLLGAA